MKRASEEYLEEYGWTWIWQPAIIRPPFGYCSPCIEIVCFHVTQGSRTHSFLQLDGSQTHKPSVPVVAYTPLVYVTPVSHTISHSTCCITDTSNHSALTIRAAARHTSRTRTICQQTVLYLFIEKVTYDPPMSSMGMTRPAGMSATARLLLNLPAGRSSAESRWLSVFPATRCSFARSPFRR